MKRIALGALLLTACTAQPASTGEPANASSAEPAASAPAPSAPDAPVRSDLMPPPDTQPVREDPASPEEPTAECDAAKAEGLVGRDASEANGAEAKRLTGARAVRWIRPGQAVTMDYSPSRLNIKVDANEKIEGFSCG
jgi:Peptidase inhibitor I78 family